MICYGFFSTSDSVSSSLLLSHCSRHCSVAIAAAGPRETTPYACAKPRVGPTVQSSGPVQRSSPGSRVQVLHLPLSLCILEYYNIIYARQYGVSGFVCGVMWFLVSIHRAGVVWCDVGQIRVLKQLSAGTGSECKMPICVLK